MEAEESREVVVEEDSIIITCSISVVEARWTEMSIAGGELAIIS